MLQTFKVNDVTYLSMDSDGNIIFIEIDKAHGYNVFDVTTNTYIAEQLDTLDAAEGTAFQWLSQVSA
jgi:uncharacterized protein YuzE